MGFGSYSEDIVSRFNNDRHSRLSVPPTRPAAAPPKTTNQKDQPAMSRLKEFTTQTARPLPIILVVDVSGSMQGEGKIQALNHAVKEMLEAFQDEADLRAEVHVAVITFGGAARLHMPLTPARRATWTDLRAEVHVAVITFGGAARLHMPLTPARRATWTDLRADGNTPLGAAFELARGLVEDKQLVPSRAYRPTIVLLSDGQPNDEWQAPLKALLASERGGKAFRMALGIGGDADNDMLKEFLASRESRVYTANEARQIREFFQLVTMSVASRSRSADPNSAPALKDEDLGL